MDQTGQNWKVKKLKKKDRIEYFIKTQRLLIIEKVSLNIAREANYVYIRSLLLDSVHCVWKSQKVSFCYNGTLKIESKIKSVS